MKRMSISRISFMSEVTLLAEGVGRNAKTFVAQCKGYVTLLAEGVGRNMSEVQCVRH